MNDSHFITVLLGVIFGLWGLLLGVGGYFFKRINDRLDVLMAACGLHHGLCRP